MVIGHREIRPSQFALGFFEEVDVLRDPVGFVVVRHHLCGEIDKLARVETPAVGIEVVDEVFGGDVGVEGATVTEVAVPKLVDRVPDELGRGAFSGFEGSKIAHQDGVFRFGAGADNRRGVVGHNRVCWRPGGDGERRTPSSGIRGRWLDDTNEVVRSRVIVRDLQEEGIEYVAKRGKVIVGGLANNGLERCRSRGKGRGDFLRCHGVVEPARPVEDWGARTGGREGDSGVRCVAWRRVGRGRGGRPPRAISKI